MSAGFGDYGLEFQDDPRMTGGEWPPPPPQPEPARTPPPAEPVDEQVAPSAAPAGDAHGRLSSWLAAQPWYSQPQQSFADLKLDARDGDWTINNYARAARIAWVHIPARLARIRAWTVLRLWMRADAPRFSEPQPPLSAVVAQGRESWADFAFACVYVPARVWSIWADYAGRMAVVAGLVALGITAVAGPGWWWDQVSGLLPSLPSVPSGPALHAPASVGQVLNDIAQVVVLLAALTGYVLIKRRNKAKNTPPSQWGGGSDNR